MKTLLFLVTAMLAGAAVASPACAAPGDLLIKLRGNYALRSQSSSIVVTRDNEAIVAKAQNAGGGEVAISWFLSDSIATEVSFGISSYDLERSGKTLVNAGQITPAVLVQYHLMPSNRLLRPYVGVGAAYMNLYSEKTGELLARDPAQPAISYSASLKGAFAPVAQIGADIAVNDQFYVNLDAKYLAANTRLSVSENGDLQTARHRSRSIIIGAGMGFRF